MKLQIPKLPFLLLLLLLLTSLFSLTYLFSKPVSKPGPSLRIRPGYTSYQTYLTHQLTKTQNPKLRKIWTTRDWDRKITVFAKFFKAHMDANLLANDSNSLCIGARVGQEVLALRQLGVSKAIGIDLVPQPPYVIQGDFHYLPFGNNSFDFEYSNVFDHALLPERFVGEIERTLKVGGVCVLHVSVFGRTDKFSANDLGSVDGVVGLFRVCEVVSVKEIDGFGLDTEVVFRKTKQLSSRVFLKLEKRVISS